MINIKFANSKKSKLFITKYSNQINLFVDNIFFSIRIKKYKNIFLL